jgi:hypothetical protein
MISQDVVVALKLLQSPQWPGFARLSDALGMSLSQVHRSIARLSESRLFVESEQTLQRANLAKFIVHGLPFAFPARLGEGNNRCWRLTTRRFIVRVPRGTTANGS